MSLNKLHPRLKDYVTDHWKGLTPIQEKSFDPIFEGKSCTIEAPTSGGKTEAVLFPLLTRIKANKQSGFKVLYIAPLKALLNDLALRVIPYTKMCYMEAFKWHGDVSQGDKVKQMLFPADILLTTPESLEAILLRKPNWKEVFANLETIVIDEAHYFALTERGSHLVSLLERIDAEIKRQPQRIAVTATIGNPQELLAWILGRNRKGISLSVDQTTKKNRDFMVHFFENEGQDLQWKLYQLLVQKKSIVFERSRTNTEKTASRIHEFNDSNGSRFHVHVKTHHSSVSKRLREEAENSIKQRNENSVHAIISTSTLELGIDIGELDQVVQIGGLNSPGSFLQRVGRTGRREGRAQFFRGLCDDEDELILLTGCVNLGLQQVSEKILFPKKAFHILAHQVICVCLQKLGTTPDGIWEILQHASCFSNINRHEFDVLINYMVEQEYLRKVGNNILVTGDQSEKDLLKANWKRLFAIFDTGPMYQVVDGKKIIGTLDSGFAMTQELPFIFVLGGQEWNAVKIDHEMQQVCVEKNKTGIAPRWKAIASFDIPFELAQEAGRLLMNKEALAFLDATAQLVLNRTRNIYYKLGWRHDEWIIESSGEFCQVYIWNFCGDKINRGLSMILTSDLVEKVEYDYKSIIITGKKEKPLSNKEVHDQIISLKEYTEKELADILQNIIEVKWFSKFSECLPEVLAKKTIQEKSIDLEGLQREMNRVVIREMSS